MSAKRLYSAVVRGSCMEMGIKGENVHSWIVKHKADEMIQCYVQFVSELLYKAL